MSGFEPKQFGKYQLLDRIAAGGMAELFRAKLTGVQGFEKLIAIKKILPNLSEEENLVKSFIDEAKLAALLHHENIIQIYDFGSMAGEYFIAMEYLFGKDLRAIAKTAVEKDLQMDLENILYIASRICAGLDYSHNLKDLQGRPINIIHRDINPQNILITYEGLVKIIDFGIAKAANHNTKTRENLIKGKLAYMSPEQANGQNIDHRSDIFSTGIILYELLASRRMFEGETLHVLSLVREAQFDPPEKVIPNLPSKLNDILLRALAKDPEDRYESCGEMLADVEEFAFELSLRPNARSFARFMQELYGEERIDEEIALRVKTKTNTAAEPGIEREPPRKGEKYEDTIVLSNTFPKVKAKQLIKVFPAEKLKKLRKKFSAEKLKRLKKNIPIERLKQLNFNHVALILGLVVFAVLAVLGIKRLPSPRSQHEISAYPIDSKDPTESGEIVKITTGKAALQAKQYALAASIFGQLLDDKHSTKQGVAEFYAKALEEQAVELIEKDPDQARELLVKALAIQPGSISGLSRLGYIYVGQKNYAKAIETYQKVAELDPQLPDTFFNLGYVYAVTEDYQQAKAMYSRVVNLSPPFTDEALFNLAVIYQKLGEREQSIKNLEQALMLNPENESAKNYLDQLKQQTGKEG